MKTLGTAFALLLACAGTAQAAAPSLVGPWMVQVTLRDCTTGAALGPAFNSLVTFQSGGTISESTGSTAFAPGQRSPGHGAWTDLGSQFYTQRMIAQIVFDTPPNLPNTPGFDPTRPVTPGFFAGWSVVTHVLNLTDASHGQSYGVNQFYKSDGTAYRSGCSTATALGFE